MVVLLNGDGTLATLALLKSKGVLLVMEPSLGGDEAFVLSRRFGVSVATELSSTAT
ncbi:hypothetical protein YC2023_078750 [Brassica napus]